jgi:hypothetical protein
MYFILRETDNSYPFTLSMIKNCFSMDAKFRGLRNMILDSWIPKIVFSC